MAEMEDKVNAILNNPQMMAQIMSMAQMLQNPAQQHDAPPPPPPPPPPQAAPVQPQASPPPFQIPGLDAGGIQKLLLLARQSGIDTNQQNLLRALRPYLSRERLDKLEKAMRAAKISALAASAFGSDMLPFFLNR